MSTWQLEKIHHATGLIPKKKRWDQEVPFFLRKARLLELDKKILLKNWESLTVLRLGMSLWTSDEFAKFQKRRVSDFPYPLVI
jgi:hypothetical protein